ncbi:hypothetical protein DFH05DRAFT_33286 [Lentinula detonsa]|uniref:Uncharacterized protein n=1 Tax=Lentinula detonsa TaxID=2804962 RepID=A0A9W8PAA2_9AGAR|nr:hypothetical protein DFH05DRAFT_33286 [Lentinula detonsa]
MLKRQRAPSPPPFSSSNIPLIADSTPTENARYTKRRRVHPPVLDGRMRGWGTTQDTLHETFDAGEDDGEEDIIEDDEFWPGSVPSDGANPNSPYKSTNGFLHELHTLQRHRVLFSTNASIQTPNSNYFAHDSSSPQPHAYDRHLHPPGKGLFSPTNIPASVNTVNQHETHALALAANYEKQYDSNSARGHYEEGNRLLGSVVLSRRRELERRPEGNDI